MSRNVFGATHEAPFVPDENWDDEEERALYEAFLRDDNRGHRQYVDPRGNLVFASTTYDAPHCFHGGPRGHTRKRGRSK